MAAEAILINPRRRRRKKSRKATHRRKRARARRNPFAMHTRKRRRRSSARARRSSRRRAHRNPRVPFIGSVNFNAIGAGTAGYIGTRYGAGFLMGVIPPEWKAANPALVRIGAKAVVGLVALPMLAKLFKLRGVSGPLALGAGIAIAVDAFETWVAPMIPVQMADYEQGYITSYETGQLTDAPSVDGAYGGGAY